MGIIAKQISKSRAKPEVILLSSGSPYAEPPSLRALAQAVAVELSEGGTSSSAQRGNVSIFAGLLAPTSTVWFDAEPVGITLGTRDMEGRRLADWQIVLTGSSGPDGNAAVTVQTPYFLMKDGSLVNGTAYKAARGRIRDALTSGRLPRSGMTYDASVKVREAKDSWRLRVASGPEIPPRPELTLFSQAARESVLTDLASLMIPLPATGERTIGLTLNDSGATLEVAVAGASDGCRVRLTFDIPVATTRAETARAQAEAGAIAGYLRKLMARNDPDLVSEGDWSWVS